MAKALLRVAFWLVPEATQRQKIQQQIDVLSAQLNAPRFTPHATVYSCYRSPGQTEMDLLKSLSATTRPFSVQISGLSGEDSLTKALYLKLENHKTMAGLHQAFHANVPRPSQFHLRPHISLLYQNIDITQRVRLFNNIVVDMESVHFTELWAVAIPQQLRTPEDLAGWMILAQQKLAEGQKTDKI